MPGARALRVRRSRGQDRRRGSARDHRRQRTSSARARELFDGRGLAHLSRHEGKLFGEAKGSGRRPTGSRSRSASGALDVQGAVHLPGGVVAAVLQARGGAARRLGAGARGVRRERDRAARRARRLPRQGREREAGQGRGLRPPEAGRAADRDPGAGARRRRRGLDGRRPASRSCARSARTCGTTSSAASRRKHARPRGAARGRHGEAGRRCRRSPTPISASDLLLTARKLEKHLTGGEPLDARHVEELVGKTWQKADRRPLDGLDLARVRLPLARHERRVRHPREPLLRSRLGRALQREADRARLPRAAHRSEAEPRGRRPRGRARVELPWLPADAPRDHRPRRRARRRPRGARAARGAGAPRRGLGARGARGSPARRVRARSRSRRRSGWTRSSRAARGCRRWTPTGHAAPPARGPRARGPARLDARRGAARGAARRLGVDAALPTLWPMAAVIEGPLGSRSRAHASRAVPRRPAGSSAWAAHARGGRRVGRGDRPRRGARGAGGRVRGRPRLARARASPSRSRRASRELGLQKQAALLHAIADARRRRGRLDDFVKLYQVLGHRAGAPRRARPRSSAPRWRACPPTRASSCAPRRVARAARDRGAARGGRARPLRGRGALRPPLRGPARPRSSPRAIYPTWADGSAAPYVVRAFAGRREEGSRPRKKALGPASGGRVAKITALRVLAAAGGLEAERILHEVATSERTSACARSPPTPSTRSSVARGGAAGRAASPRARAREGGRGDGRCSRRRRTKDVREAAVHALVELGHLSRDPGAAAGVPRRRVAGRAAGGRRSRSRCSATPRWSTPSSTCSRAAARTIARRRSPPARSASSATCAACASYSRPTPRATSPPWWARRCGRWGPWRSSRSWS